MIKPFSPDEAFNAKERVIPSFVILAVNTLLSERFDGKSCTIKQNEVIELAEQLGVEHDLMPDWASRDTFFKKHWLDFEPLYRSQGWKVRYDKPAYNETYEAFWEFARDGEREMEARGLRRM